MSDDRLLRQISARLSLRKPQEQALVILADVLARIPFDKSTDPAAALAAIQAAYPDVQDFERDFPSLCFALATGVGKTRLMGAFITWLVLSKRSRNFFVLAPSTTIYEKLIADFSPTGAKYVFKGIAEFAALPPLLVTGENWDEGRGVRDADLLAGTATINIFNVDKINKEAGRIKRLQEYIGESYFDYLSNLPDLVLLMDEAHRYRAKAGMKAVAELRPVLGLELTATPKTVGANPQDFRNVIYRYGLAEAMADGFVKEPAVATRKDFDPRSRPADELERIKLEDGIHAHENVKADLTLYARENSQRLVHPFMLVVAQNTAHADELRETLESDDFFAGRYKGRVIVVHSNLRGEESEEATARLLKVETDAATDIVIHVNKLKEGWDVANLYTIVPLRASASDILTEQTIGRGLRLPYGVRTGVPAVDTLTIIAHDRFDEVIQKAREPGSLIHKSVTIGPGGDIPSGNVRPVEIPSLLEAAITGNARGMAESQQPLFPTVAAQTTATITLDVIRRLERELPNLAALKSTEIQRRIAAQVTEIAKPAQGTLDGIPIEGPTTSEIVATVAATIADNAIEIPEIVVLPTSDVTFTFTDFDLQDLSGINYQPLTDEILLQELRTEQRRTIAIEMPGHHEERLEDYLVTRLISEDAIDYDTTSDLLYKLSAQVVAHFRSYLPDEEAVENVLVNHSEELAILILRQMMTHYVETPTRYVARVTRGFHLLKPLNFKLADANARRDFRRPVTPLSDTRRHVFTGFRKCAFPDQSFQSDEERRFAVLIDRHEPDVLRWVKPGPKQLRIEYRRGEPYWPDFVVETTSEKLIVEIKARKDLEDETVKAKSTAARTWIGYANAHAASHGGKPWRYLFIPHDRMTEATTLPGLIAECTQSEILEDAPTSGTPEEPASPPPEVDRNVSAGC